MENVFKMRNVHVLVVFSTFIIVKAATTALGSQQVADTTPGLSAAKPDAPAASPLQENSSGLLPAGIKELYLLAKGNDPELSRMQARVAASSADTDVVRAGFRPRASASFGINQIDQTLLHYESSATHSSVFGYNYGVSARMPLLHLSTAHYLSAAKAAVRSDEAGASAALQNLIVKLADAYFSVLKAKTETRIAEDELSRLKQILEQARAYLKAGTGDIIAVYEAQARLDGVHAELNRAEIALTLAEQKLSSIVGQPVTAKDYYLQLQPKGPEPDNVDWWLAAMEKQDPQLKQAKESLNQMMDQTRGVKREHYPVIDASAGYTVSKGSAFLPDIETRQWYVGAVVSVPLYSGGETEARIRRSAALNDERKYYLDSVRDSRRENLKQAFFQIRYSVSQINALKQREASSEIQLTAVKKGRSLGTRTAIDLLNAEQAYSIAQRDLKNAIYDNFIKNIQLKAAAGVLDEGDLTGS